MRSQTIRRLPRFFRQYSNVFQGSSFYRGTVADPLLNRNCLITGGSSGIGFAIAKRFVVDGANSVVITGRDSTKLQAAKEELEAHKKHYQAVGSFPGDITEPGLWFSGSARAVLEGIDTLVNAAGISQNNLLTYTSDEEIRLLLDTNLTATIITSKAFVKGFMRGLARDRSNQESPGYENKIANPVGNIINISSLLGFKRGAGSTAYAASKAGMIGFTRALAHEMSMREKRTLAIRVNAIVPGYIDTPMVHEIANLDRVAQSIPLGRLGTPDEVADAAVFLACNSYAHNCVLNLDGGLSAT